jgi:excisionase family DNA binding protein
MDDQVPDLDRGAIGGLWDLRAVARYLAVSERTVWTLAATGKLPCVRIGRRRLFDSRDIESFVQRRKLGGER